MTREDTGSQERYSVNDRIFNELGKRFSRDEVGNLKPNATVGNLKKIISIWKKIGWIEKVGDDTWEKTEGCIKIGETKMTREESKRLLPFIQAYAGGKIIQYKDHRTKKWVDLRNVFFDNLGSTEIRIKPESTYRPFKDPEECWNEMQKHQPFGWLKAIELGAIAHVDYLGTEAMSFAGCGCATFKHVFERYNFADGTPFGIKEGGEQ